DFLDGSQDNDTIFGGQGNDTILGLGGDNLIYGNLGNDSISGGVGDDSLFGGQGNDIMLGAIGNDVIYGNLGNDILSGILGNHTIFGGQGNDTIISVSGVEVRMFGNLGSDTFDFASNEQTPPGQVVDDAHSSHIADFVTGVDKITLDLSDFVDSTPDYAELSAPMVTTLAGAITAASDSNAIAGDEVIFVAG